ncbi:hypothetical protein SALBM311S_09323 [Streptomyces alboniger]
MYSPALRPSSIRAAPAKKRIWSTIGGISSERVSPIGLPVFSTSAAMSSSARSSNASAIFRRAFWRSAGVVSRQAGKAAAAAGHRGVHVRLSGQRRGRVRLARRGVDHFSGPSVDGVPELSVDVVAQTTQLGAHCRPPVRVELLWGVRLLRHPA